ncbi:39S ribosomal protein L39, mitochondrial [Arapaima gigas]
MAPTRQEACDCANEKATIPGAPGRLRTSAVFRRSWHQSLHGLCGKRRNEELSISLRNYSHSEKDEHRNVYARTRERLTDIFYGCTDTGRQPPGAWTEQLSIHFIFGESPRCPASTAGRMACSSVCGALLRRMVSSTASTRPSTTQLHDLRNALFSKEKARQRALITRTEKIEVTLEVPGEQGSLLFMNKGVSTPHCCARHLTEWHVSSSALALVDGEPWPMHRPLTKDCSLALLHFKMEDPDHVNKAYWRSCAALLGQVLKNAFKEDFSVELLRSPEIPVLSGAFCCDLVLDSRLDQWVPSEEELRSLTRDAHQLMQQNLPWEPLEVLPSFAMEVFSHSSYKQKEVEERAAESANGLVTLYRCGDYVFLSGAPLVARTGLCSQFEVTAIHNLAQTHLGLHRRAQGLSLPVQLEAHHTVWRKLRKRAERLVEIRPACASDAKPSVPDVSAVHSGAKEQ